MPSPSLVRRLAAGLALTVALPAAAAAQPLTYRFTGLINNSGLTGPLAFALAGDAADVTEGVQGGFQVLQNPGLTGNLRVGATLTPIPDATALIPQAAPFNELFLFTIGNGGGTGFALRGSVFSTYDLRALLGPVTVDIVAGLATEPIGTGTFEVVAGSDVSLPGGPVATVPEPGTWALLGTGLLAVGGVARRRRTTAA